VSISAACLTSPTQFHSHTHPLRNSHNLTLTLIHSPTHTNSLSDTHSHTHKATLIWFSRSTKITHQLTQSHSHTHPLTNSHNLYLTLTKPHLHTQVHCHALSLSSLFIPPIALPVVPSKAPHQARPPSPCSQSQVAGRPDFPAMLHAVSPGHRRRQFSVKNDLLTCSA